MILEDVKAMDTEDNNKTTESVFKDVFKKFHSTTKSPETYLSIQTEKAEKSRKLLKTLFDYARSKDVFVGHKVPLQIAVTHMDEEQIWQQLELMNDYLFSKSLETTSRLLAATDEKLSLNYKKVGDESDDESRSVDGIESNEGGTSDDVGSDLNSNEENDDDESPSKEKSQKKLPRKSIVDDKFFKLSEMEAFLDAEDKKEMRKNNGTLFQSNGDEIDYFNGDFSEDNDDEEDNTEANAKYWNFFDGDSEDEQEIRQRKREQRNVKNQMIDKRKKEDLGLDDSDIDDNDDENVEELNEEENIEDDDGDDVDASQKKVAFDMSKNSYRSDSEEEEDEEEADNREEKNLKTAPNDDPEDKSAFELRQERLRNRINEFEEAALGEKSWQLKGEITSTSRPQNSLLEEVLEFDSTTRPAPIITEETTLQLEDIIKQRIKDKAWNDVERKYKPVHTPQEFRKKLVLDQEKSKESLAQIYEKEYLNEIEKIDPNAGEKVEEEPKEHTEIRNLLKSLFAKLDALSNFYYTPKPAIPEVKIITNTPAINMEEVAPIGTSDATLLAPEEIRSRAKGDVMGKSERTSTDKKRERRMKKLKQKSIKIAKEKRAVEKEKQGISLSTKEERDKLMNKVTKSRNVQKMKETIDGSIKSSKAFFSQLQDQVTVKSKSKSKRKPSTNDGVISAKKLKL